MKLEASAALTITGLLALMVIVLLFISYQAHTQETIVPNIATDIRSVLYGEVAPGKIYTTIGNPKDLGLAMPTTSPRLIELAKDGTLIWETHTTSTPIAYQKLPNNTLAYAFLDKNDRTLNQWNIVDEIDKSNIKIFSSNESETIDSHTIALTGESEYLVPFYKKTRITGAESEYATAFLIYRITNQGKELFWDSLDHIPLSDKVTLQKTIFDEADTNNYFHGNHIDILSDGNYLISARNTSQVLKIASTTGEVLWTLGGKSSDFTFINDPLDGFNHQHAAQELPNGNILLYDNGNYHNPPQSRVSEYKLNHTNDTAELVWSFQVDGRFTYAAGSVQRLENGNTLIGWGMEKDMTANVPRITEVNRDKKVLMEIYFPENILFYSAYKY